MPVGIRLVLAFGVKLVLQFPPLRDRLASKSSSTGLPRSTTQEGLATAEKSAFLAEDTQLSSLQSPTPEMSAASTAYAPLAAHARSANGNIAMTTIAALARPALQNFIES